jgi:glucose-1-phosphate adenylyltransferase
MGIYVFDSKELVQRLKDDGKMPEGEGGDFGHHVIPRMLGEVPIYAHSFEGLGGEDKPYWRDVGTIEAYFDAHMDLCDVKPQLNLYRKDWPTYTLWHNDPPAKTVFNEPDEGDERGRRAEVVDSLLAPGVVVSGGIVHRSILSNLVYIDERAELDECIVMRGARIGKNCKLKRCIIDKWNEVPEGTVIGFDREQDEQRFTVSPTGIVVIGTNHQWE